MRLFFMISGQGRALWAQAGGALALAALIAGCGDNYRPTVTPVNGNGPPAQPASYAVVVSSTNTGSQGSTGASSDGVVTIIDYSGDTIMTEATIGPGPTAFTIDNFGSNGYTLNSDGTLSNFAISTSLQTKNVSFSSVSSTAQIVNLMPPASGLWATDLNGDQVDLFAGSPQAFKQSIPVASSGSAPTMPVFIAGSPTPSGQREYVLSQNVGNANPLACNISPRTAGVNGVATPIEISSDTADPSMPVGICPVYAVETSDLQRLFVLNRGDDTITVINTANNTLDSCTPFQNQNGQWVTCHKTIQLPAGSGPIYAEYNAATQKLVVANYDGGTVSVIDVPLDQYGNDANTYTNSNCTTYAACGTITGGFGTVHTIAVGNTATPNPASVTVLYDGSKAYTANQNDDSTVNSTGNGTVTVINLTTYTVEKTLTVVGHPRTVVSTQNSEYAKVYVDSPDQPYITIIQSTPTITDQIDTAVNVEGLPIDIRTTTQNGTSGNNNYSSRVPGYGQPCNLSDGQLKSKFGASYLSTLTLAECQLQSTK
jgi:DNA-binding beta-propeller fold protein YncE